MNNLLFKKWNDFSGWIVFLIAAFVYGMTIEPTASFWDCPEFISCAEKLQVGHSTGCTFLYARRKPVYPVCFRGIASVLAGEFSECVVECRLHPVSFLEHHPVSKIPDSK